MALTEVENIGGRVICLEEERLTDFEMSPVPQAGGDV